MPEDLTQNSIRTYKRRGSRVTANQQSARDLFWEQWGLTPEGIVDLRALMVPAREVILEVGSGMGETTALMAAAAPDIGIVAAEVHRPGIGALLSYASNQGLLNVRIFDGDALDLMRNNLAADSLDGVRLYFPDPWPKFKHHKRRIFNEEFLDLVFSRVRAGGFLHAATDWFEYAQWMQSFASKDPRFVGGVIDRPEWRPLTKFEGQGVRKGHVVTDLYYEIKK
ncbi:MAG: tRNA (guanosine(46)-N7)-methyltransferase TrmB [Actinomycetes bacterium]